MVAARSESRVPDGSVRLEPWQLIRKARRARGWSQEFLAKQVGVSQPAIVNIERGSTVRSKFLSRIAKALELNLTDLDSGLALLVIPEARAVRVDVNFPIHPSSEQGDGEIMVQASPRDYFPRPGPLAHVKGGYGVYVTGTSMEPEFRPGEIALANPHLPVTGGNAYIFYAEREGAGRATIKVLRRESEDRWFVTQHNPLPGASNELVFSRKDWPWAHRLIGKYARR
jgi:phage repressor protein C with HTH and peptisase S24 domain